MRSAALVPLVLLFGSTALGAQTASPNQKSFGVATIEGLGPGSPNTVTTINVPINVGCPVGLRAQHGADGGLLNVDRSRPERPAQVLHLTLTNPDSRRIVSARVRVRGLSGKGRVTETLAGQNDADATATLTVQLSQGTGKEAAGDLRVPDMTAVLSISLNSLTYADGSTWSFSGREGCRVAPDMKMLIAGR